MPTPRILVATIAVAAAAATFASSAFAESAYDRRVSALIAQVKSDPDYKRLPLDSTADRQWFIETTEKLFSHTMTKDQFVANGAQRFPGYEASLNTIADFMTK